VCANEQALSFLGVRATRSRSVTGYLSNAAALFGGYDPTKVRFAPSSVLLPDASRQNWLWDVFGENRFVTMVAEGVCEHGIEPQIRRAFGP
jgi:hypothetical protein